MYFKSLIAPIFLMPVMGCTTIPLAPNIESAEDVRAIKSVVLDYFQGQGTADANRLNRAFASDVAAMITVNDTGDAGTRFQRTEMATIIPAWSSNPNPPGDRSDYEFMSVDIIDQKLAVVTFRSTNRFYDALTLLKADEDWKIVSKVYVKQGQ